MFIYYSVFMFYMDYRGMGGWGGFVCGWRRSLQRDSVAIPNRFPFGIRWVSITSTIGNYAFGRPAAFAHQQPRSFCPLHDSDPHRQADQHASFWANGASLLRRRPIFDHDDS